MNVIKESFKYTKKYLPAWITICLLGFACVTANMLLPQAPQLIIDMIINPALGEAAVDTSSNIFSGFLSGFAPNDYWGMFLTLLLIVGILSAVRYLGHYLRWNLSHAYGVEAEKDMRQAVFAKLMKQNSVVMSRYTSGDLMSIANSDPVVMKDCWSQHFSIVLDQFVAIALAVFFLSRISWYLMIIPFVLGIATAVVMVFYVRSLRARYNDIRENSIALNTCVQENINGVRIVRGFASEEIEKKKFAGKNKNFKDSFVRQAKTASVYNVWFMALSQAVNLSSIIIGVVLATQGKITLGEFTTFLAYVTMINAPLITLTNFVGLIQNAMICGNRMFTFLNTNNLIVDPPNPNEIVGNPNITLFNASVQLDDAVQLKNVSVDIPYGKKLGIMGKTGSGKSVFIKTLPRFFETTQGETCINGINIKNYKVEDVRRQFSYVMQDVFLFSNTVDSNIAFYDLDTAHEEVEKAARVAAAHDFILKLENGYDTIVGEKGLGLSGGQKQRISIARALLKNAPILLFDDCTSALDLETERKILQGIRENYAEKTLIISSHRATSVMDCDEILYMEEGAIVEKGTHEELMNRCGKYFEVFMSQAASAKEAIS